MSKSEITLQIAKKHEELAELYRLMAAPVEAQSPSIRKEERKSGEILCGCDKPAKRVEGKAKSGRNEGQPYVMYVCAEPRESRDNCGFRQFED